MAGALKPVKCESPGGRMTMFSFSDAMLSRCRLFLLPLATLLVSACCLPAGHRRVCGHNLANVLAMVCEGRGYNDPFSVAGSTHSPKRSVESSTETKGVADECCRVGCTYRTMEQYCSPASVADTRSGLSGSAEGRHEDAVLSRPSLRALLDQVRGRKRRRGKARCSCRRRRRRRRRRGKRVENVEQRTTTAPPPPFRVGMIDSYFDGVVFATANRIKPLNLSDGA